MTFAHIPQGSQNHFAAALLALMKEKPYGQITVTDLCRQAGHARQTFYKYFPDKEAVLEYLADGLYLKYLSQRDYQDRAGFFTFWYDLRDIAQVLISQGLMDRMTHPSDETKQYLRAFVRCPSLAGDRESEDMFLEFVSAGEVRLLECWCRQGWKNTPQQMADILDIFLQGGLRLEYPVL